MQRNNSLTTNMETYQTKYHRWSPTDQSQSRRTGRRIHNGYKLHSGFRQPFLTSY